MTYNNLDTLCFSPLPLDLRLLKPHTRFSALPRSSYRVIWVWVNFDLDPALSIFVWTPQHWYFVQRLDQVIDLFFGTSNNFTAVFICIGKPQGRLRNWTGKSSQIEHQFPGNGHFESWKSLEIIQNGNFHGSFLIYKDSRGTFSVSQHVKMTPDWTINKNPFKKSYPKLVENVAGGVGLFSTTFIHFWRRKSHLYALKSAPELWWSCIRKEEWLGVADWEWLTGSLPIRIVI